MARRKMSRAEVKAANRKIDAFNKARQARLDPPSPPKDLSGPWMSTETLNKLPQMRGAFDRSRDPLVAAQIRELEKSERQRREEQSGRGSAMIEKDAPSPTLTPNGSLRRGVDGPSFNARWMQEQRDAAFAASNAEARERNSAPAYDRNFRAPEV